METEIYGANAIYKFNLKRLDNGGLFLFGKTGKFITPDSDGDKLENVIAAVKDRETITITVTAASPQTYRVGQRFKYCDGRIYILVAFEKKQINLINIDSGSRWSQTITVENAYAVTEDEMRELANKYGDWKNFVLME